MIKGLGGKIMPCLPTLDEAREHMTESKRFIQLARFEIRRLDKKDC